MTAFGRLVELIIDQAEEAASLADDSGDQQTLHLLASHLRDLNEVDPPPAVGHAAVDRWLPTAVAAAPDPQRPLADAFAAVAPRLAWNTAYPAANPTPAIERFWENYAFAALAVPDGDGGLVDPGPFRSPDVSLFLVVQGADVEYGLHHHPAIEIYGVVSGTARWLRGDEGYRPRPPGSVFVHPSDAVHATTTGAEPTISWAAWLGDTHTLPILRPPDGTDSVSRLSTGQVGHHAN